ncbi:UDP-N-acetylglucosamine 1-carboxyvinyltransferase [Thermanaeromonas sp. C210]|uniref:UDP-N-acetylglucosamine 1-carboxyvinyltransferase n=1 Tax=Thermanaeromonas sp. C210 TaxID=2731925 RepID=UPI00155CAC2D|nr:UDP-N-acetylglucosamine 1-carboxyvinyltransferase [Thermanaeromonas sp. C210]GFN24073.1 UDP-N-acetylglucosamine 1-carboxyvinyltransferase [Thermanaeromonas sp. C210]
MERLVIVGGNRLEGELRVSGAKNAVLPLIAATLLTRKPCVLEGVPDLRDVAVMMEVASFLGAEVKKEGESLYIHPAGAASREILPPLMRRLRASNLVMGPLLGRWHYFKVAYPGGCAIGSRPMDLHLKGFVAMGASIVEKQGFIEAKASRLRGADILLDFPSVGATENIMMAAVLAEGVTLIRNAAREPEIVDLQNFLNKLGARIQGAGQDVIRIEGVKELTGASHRVIPDRIEAGTYLAAVAGTKGKVFLRGARYDHMAAVIAKLREMGARVEEDPAGIRLEAEGRLKAVDCRTLPYPGFPTDMQPQIMALMTTAKGTSILCESIFENRFRHAAELKRMGADVKIEGKIAVINGVSKLSGAVVEATDLRAGAALVVAGLMAEGVTYVEGVHHLDRGYERMESKFQSLGAQLTREREG